MNKSIRAIMLAIIIVLVILIVIPITLKLNLLPSGSKDNMWNKSLDKTSSSVSVGSENTHEDNTLYHVGDEVETDGAVHSFKYRINKVIESKSRNIINFPVTEIWNEVTTDSKGNITNKFSYILLQIDITNMLNQEQELYLNTNSLDFRDKNGTAGTEMYSTEPVAMNHNIENSKKKDAMQFVFKPKEHVAFELVYIAEDKYLDSSYTMVFSITNESASMVYDPKTKKYLNSDEAKFIQIRQEDIEKK